MNVDCHLCAQGDDSGECGHGLRVPGLGMLDVVCPISEERLDALVEELKTKLGEIFTDDRDEPGTGEDGRDEPGAT